MGDAPIFQNKKEEKRDMPQHDTCSSLGSTKDKVDG